MIKSHVLLIFRCYWKWAHKYVVNISDISDMMKFIILCLFAGFLSRPATFAGFLCLVKYFKQFISKI